MYLKGVICAGDTIVDCREFSAASLACENLCYLFICSLSKAVSKRRTVLTAKDYLPSLNHQFHHDNQLLICIVQFNLLVYTMPCIITSTSKVSQRESDFSKKQTKSIHFGMI